MNMVTEYAEYGSNGKETDSTDEFTLTGVHHGLFMNSLSSNAMDLIMKGYVK
ncbi:hypothetical protein [Paenibacillus sp. 23TSA30-6]|uniref:hypothetical protein n=1 Tax=Paenibacillus sp. 23TSA30-6 TaxID=2546104 RepID=UPI001788846B|nr:hypothetical protein [Paenibacillus sp. 23TSA30-6]